MSQLHEFAQHKTDFEQRNVRILAISIDDPPHAREVWRKVVSRQFSILSDPGAQRIRRYGLLHSRGDNGKSEDIAIRTSVLVDEQGREVWRRVSPTAYDVANVRDVLARIDQSR